MRPQPSKIPAPFRRPSIDLSPVNREWREVEASTLAVGDIVAQFGRVTDIKQNYATGPWEGFVKFTVFNGDGDYREFIEHNRVLAFVRRNV